MGITAKGEMDQLVEYFEVYEKIKISYINFFYKVPPDPEQMKAIKKDCDTQVKAIEEELAVQLKEQEAQMTQAVQGGEMLPERFELEMKNAKEMMVNQMQAFKEECLSKLVAEASKVDNQVISEKDFNELMKNPKMAENLVDKIQNYNSRIKKTWLAQR